MVKTKKPKIKTVMVLDGFNAGAYEPATHTIYLNKDLNKFPKAKKIITEHELKHSKSTKFYHYLRDDFIDYFTLPFKEELVRFCMYRWINKYEGSDEKDYWKFIMIYKPIIFVLSIITSILFAFTGTYYLLRWTKQKKKL